MVVDTTLTQLKYTWPMIAIFATTLPWAGVPSLLHVCCELFSTNVQKADFERSFFVEHEFNHLADDSGDTLCYDKNVTSAGPCLQWTCASSPISACC